jgi:DNA-binding NarL/FixJ family response regulator
MNTHPDQTVSVLIADNSAAVRERLADLLKEEASIRVVGLAASASEAWALFEQRQPAAVVLDIQLPDGNGLEVLRRIKEADPGCVVLMLANYNDPVFRSECRRHGADHFLCTSTEFERTAQLITLLAKHRTPPGPAAGANGVEATLNAAP